MVIKTQTIDGNQAITSGYFTEFEWKGTKFEAMDFITIHTFNNDLKIIKQIDWIKYPPNLLNTTYLIEAKKTDKIVGTWKLVEFSDFDTISKQWVYPFGKEAQGYFTYTNDKTVIVNIFNQNPIKTTKDSINVVRYSFSDILFNSPVYFGKYSLDHKNGTLVHHVKGGAIPWYINTNQSRPFKLQNDTLFIGDMVNWKRVLVKLD